MFNNWKVKDLTLAGFSIPTILMIGFSLMVYSTSNQSAVTFKQVDTSQKALNGNKIMSVYILNMDRRVRRYMFDFNFRPTALVLHEEDKKMFLKGLEIADSVVEDGRQKENLKIMKQIYDEYEIFKQKTIQQGMDGYTQKEIEDFFAYSKEILDRFEVASNRFESVENEIMNKSINSTKSSIFLLSSSSLIAALLTIIIATFATVLISQYLGNRIKNAVQVAEKISVGDLTQNVIEDSSNSLDEVGQLLKAFQYMTQNLSNIIKQVQLSGIQVTSSATQIASSGKQLEASINEQLASTNEVTASAKQIAATSKELVKTVEEVTTTSQATTVAASDSQKDLLRMESTMKQLLEATNSIASRLGIISEKANNINNIVVTITKVADQTNLLSLNAAIEAEKAGEYGLGFAVVAREIRRLADQTAVATIDIEQMVKQMQSSVSTGVMEMDKFATEVSQSVEDVGNISSQIGHIIEKVQDLTPRYEVVSQGIEAQTLGAIQISEAMSQLSSNSTQTAASLREINNAIGQLNQVAQALRQEMNRFKLSESLEPYAGSVYQLKP